MKDEACTSCPIQKTPSILNPSAKLVHQSWCITGDVRTTGWQRGLGSPVPTTKLIYSVAFRFLLFGLLRQRSRERSLGCSRRCVARGGREIRWGRCPTPESSEGFLPLLSFPPDFHCHGMRGCPGCLKSLQQRDCHLEGTFGFRAPGAD